MSLMPKSLYGRIFLILTAATLGISAVGNLYEKISSSRYAVCVLLADHSIRMAESIHRLPVRVRLESHFPEQSERVSTIVRELSTAQAIELSADMHPVKFRKSAEARDEISELPYFLRENHKKTREVDSFDKLFETILKLSFKYFAKIYPDQIHYSLDVNPVTPSGESVSLIRSSERPLEYVSKVLLAVQGRYFYIEDRAVAIPNIFRLPFWHIIILEIVIALIALLIINIFIRPLRQMAAALDAFGYNPTKAPPFPETGAKELRETAKAFNRMQSSITEFVNERTSVVAALSHDLRTPLTRLRLRVETLPEEKRSGFLKDIDALTATMDSTMELAKSSHEDLAVIDISAMLESMVEDRAEAGEPVSLVMPEEKLPFWKGRPECMKRCINNLIDNGLKYGGEVTVSPSLEKDHLMIRVTDNGPGMPDDVLAKAMEPFYRGEPSRNRNTGGSGLGLSISRNMARLHGGDLKLSNRAEGGLCAEASFRKAP
ncbi:MAG: HAMP domain-containing protein [Mailhella sp.]|nr:HAMP domain-containing protein [Mailhella sp.]